MYFEACSVFRGTYGRVNPLFSHPEDAVMIIWKPGEYGKIYFMFMSQLYPHYKEFHVHNWSMIVYSTETSGAIRRRVDNPPVTGGQIHRMHLSKLMDMIQFIQMIMVRQCMKMLIFQMRM